MCVCSMVSWWTSHICRPQPEKKLPRISASVGFGSSFGRLEGWTTPWSWGWSWLYQWLHINMYIYMYIYIYMSIYLHVCICSLLICICIHMYISIITYIYICKQNVCVCILEWAKGHQAYVFTHPDIFGNVWINYIITHQPEKFGPLGT